MSPAVKNLGWAALAAALLGAVGASGCSTDAFCFAECAPDAGATTSTSTSSGAGGGLGIGGSDAGCLLNCGGGSASSSSSGAGGSCDLTSPHSCGLCSNDCFALPTNWDPKTIGCTPSKNPGVDPGTCTGTCAQDYYDLDKNAVGCEYYCVQDPGDPNDQTCDNVDQNCNGVKDEGVDVCSDVANCGKCGGNCVVVHGTPACNNTGMKPCDVSNTQCSIAKCDCSGPGNCFWDLDNSYATGCEYQCDKTNGGVEICDGLDNDCNGKIDAADPGMVDPTINVACFGGQKGICADLAHAGLTQCAGGVPVCVGANVLVPNQVLETCNALDDDCDGVVDNNPTDAGKACGQSNVAPCAKGTEQCQAGALVCIGAVNPGIETCNGIDDNCNGVIDDAPVDAGGACGLTNVGACKLGVLACGGGVLGCVGAILPAPETCNGADDDCDGKIDNNPAGAGVTCGQSGTAPCALGTMQCQNAVLACVGAVNPKSETCNQVDDDCNGVVDDNVVGTGVSCGASGTFPCSFGTIQCKAGVIGCVGNVDPQAETCNGKDDNCNGIIDDAVAGAGASCGTSNVGTCKLGTQQCQGGAFVCVGKIDPLPETCNGKDDDCNGVIDNNPTGVGAQCGASNVGPCKFGSFQCQAGALACVGAVGPSAELCNGIDDNCNGTVDDNPTDVGASCGTSNTFPCSFGTMQCQVGAKVCVGAVNPKSETCNGVDDNCDGQIDLTGGVAPPDSVGPCNVPIPPPAGATSPCKAGAKACQGGSVACVGSVGPSGPTDTCGVDANCDGALTNQPNTQTDVNNCGSCGNSCVAGAVHANWSCVAGGCVFQGCQTGYYDNGGPGDAVAGDKKCGYPCTFISGTEACNGTDDNCNGQIDEGVVAPSPVQVCGVSPSALSPECTSGVNVACNAGSWKCTFPAGVCGPTCASAAEVCDTLDNNCNGQINENTPKYGQPCASDDGVAPPGDGACRTTGTFVCTGPATVACSAVKASCAGLPGGCTELCDGIDNDCDGLVDEPYTNKGGNAANFVKPTVTRVSATLWTYSFEASRPNATTVIPGSGDGYFCSAINAGDPNCNDATIPVAPAGVPLDKTRSCSVPSKIPWFNVTPAEGEQVCKAAGGRLCSTLEWQSACNANAGCTFGYNPRGATCTTPLTATKYCNLGPFDFNGGVAGDQDGLLVTGSAALQNCWADWSGLQGNQGNIALPLYNKILDITGNLREMTKSAANVYPLMGGAFDTSVESGAACSFSFYTVDKNFELFDLGFRCCFSADPTQ